MEGERTVLWIGDSPPPVNVRGALGADWRLIEWDGKEALEPQLKQATVVAVGVNGCGDESRWMEWILRELDGAAAAAVFLVPNDARATWSVLSRRSGHFLCMPQDATAEELEAKLATAGAIQRGINGAGGDDWAVGGPLYKAREMEEELRLAATLQRDFLPKKLPEVGRVRFDVLYRPVGYVSGDIYDVMRLDETRVGFYVADVVGHGLPAALLTMFIKKALLTKRIDGRKYEIISPAASLSALNADICEQNLTSCHFCTAVYCVVDTERLTMTYSRAGHPEPIIARADGTIDLGDTPGSLLGIFPNEEFLSTQMKLSPGDRLILYSDGAEWALFGRTHLDDRHLRESIVPLAAFGREEMFAAVSAKLDSGEIPAKLADDATILVMDVE